MAQALSSSKLKRSSRNWALAVLLVATTTAFIAFHRESRWLAMCWLGGQTPSANIVSSPTPITTEWQEFPIPSGIEPTGHSAWFYLTVSGKQFGVRNQRSSPQHRSIESSSELVDLHTQKPLVVQVKILDEHNKAVQLTQRLTGTNDSLRPGHPTLVYGLAHSKWEAYFFAPGVTYKKIAIKASEPIELLQLEWSLSAFCKGGINGWKANEPNKLYHFDRPSPPQNRFDRTPSEVPYPRELYHVPL